MIIKKLSVQAIILLVVIMFLSPITFAQIQKNDLSVEHDKRIHWKDRFYVHVKDAATEEPIDEASVTLMKEGNVWDSGLTGDNGYRLFYPLSPGVYKITVEKYGYNTYGGEVEVKGDYLPPIDWTYAARVIAELEAIIKNRDWEDFKIVVNVEYRFSRNWGIGLEGSRYNFKVEDSTENFHWWNVSPTIRYYFQTKNLRPSINIGPSLYIPEKEAVRIGGKIGAGIELAISKSFAIEIGADYHTIFKKSKKSLDNENIGDFLGLHGGIALRF